jgi:phage tail-like protein
MALSGRTDPFLAYNFLVEIRSVIVGGFSEVTGLQREIEVQEYREGGVNEYVHKLYGPTRYPSNLVLKRGLTDIDLWSWHEAVALGLIQRLSGSIVLQDAAGGEKWRWDFRDAYPVRWTGPELRAGAAAVAVETLELVHRGLSAKVR